MSQSGARFHAPNALLSRVDNNLDNYFKKRVLAVHADKCIGQNKNLSAIAYIARWSLLVH